MSPVGGGNRYIQWAHTGMKPRTEQGPSQGLGLVGMSGCRAPGLSARSVQQPTLRCPHMHSLQLVFHFLPDWLLPVIQLSSLVGRELRDLELILIVSKEQSIIRKINLLGEKCA